MSDNTTKQVTVSDGVTVTFDVLTWDEGWDFGHPTCILRPVIAYSPNGDACEDLIGSVCESAAFDGFLRSDGTEDGMIDRQFPLQSLKRRWGMSRGGKEFPVLRYSAHRFIARFYRDPRENELTFEITEVENGGNADAR
jgi:hypothetical protein